MDNSINSFVNKICIAKNKQIDEVAKMLLKIANIDTNLFTIETGEELLKAMKESGVSIELTNKDISLLRFGEKVLTIKLTEKFEDNKFTLGIEV